jgi:cytidylate kinase
MIITISGEIGSGKGTIGKSLSKRLNYNFYSMGNIRRETAKEHGMTIDKFNKIGEEESWTDVEVDNHQKELSKRENIILDGRLSWYFVPNSKKIYLDVEPEIATKRIFEDQRETEKKFKELKEVIEYNKKRKESDIKRYEKYYKINPYKREHYDLIVDTSNKTPNEVIKTILKNLE